MARLTEQDWLDHGLKTLATQGVGALKAAKMAEKLGVSRGSFYWHFEDMRAFETRLLDRWQELTTDETIREMESEQREAERLPGLMIRALVERPDLDRAIRVWAEIDAKARAKLRKVDALRIGYLCNLLVASGLAEDQALHRARFIYAASLGDAAIAPDASPPFTTAQIRELAELVSRPGS
ncbi:MAG: TetR family transcriptional regulator [Pseudomonadota bacterium]